MRVGIIGGGAAGLFSAIHLKLMNPNFEVTILERDSRVGKKILATGNGKCNITNLGASEKDYNDSKVLYALNNFSVFDTINYFKKLGLMIKFDSEGRCYPYSEKATTVLDVLMNMINRLKINICTNYEVVHVKAYDDFMVYSRDYGLKHFDYLIVSTGGKSGINFNNESYNFLEYLGHTVTNLYPGLVPLKTKEKLKNLSGIRSKAKVKLLREQKLIFNTTGEVLYKEEGLSGISIMEVSRHALPGDVISLDLVYDLSDEEVTNFLKNEKNIFGLLPKMVATEVTKRGNNLLYTLRNFSFVVEDTYGFMNSQVTKGGVSFKEVNPITFESLIVPKMYIIGEVLDVDGNSGGYNLQFAWSSAYSAAKNIIEKEVERYE